MPLPICTSTRGKNIDCLIKMRGSTDFTSDEEPIASIQPKRKKKTKAKTKSATINNLPPNKSIVDTSTTFTNNQSSSKTSTAATANVTVPSEIASVNLPKQSKAKKNATKTTFLTSCNPKHKKDLDEGTDDNNFPDPPAVEDHVPIHVCNWAQAIVCDFPQLAPLKCQHTDCNFFVHHLCQAAWEQREGYPDTLARYCCLHHPHSTNTNM
jgi:hypothetical protein